MHWPVVSDLDVGHVMHEEAWLQVKQEYWHF